MLTSKGREEGGLRRYPVRVTLSVRYPLSMNGVVSVNGDQRKNLRDFHFMHII